MIFGMCITTFLGFVAAYVFGTYLWVCKITQQTLNDMTYILRDIQYQTTIGAISITELALIAKGKNTYEVSELDTPEGLIKLIERLQNSFSFSPKFQLACYKYITREIEPRMNRWEKEFKKIK